MKCRRVQELLSPYLDERLTGQQMLEVRDHLDGCRSCTEEYLEIRQVKTLLRTVAMKQPGALFEERFRAEVACERRSATLVVMFPAFTMPGRGRRLAYAAALSCVSVLALAHGAWAPNKISVASRTPIQSIFDAPPHYGFFISPQPSIDVFKRQAPMPTQLANQNTNPFAAPGYIYNSSRISFAEFSH